MAAITLSADARADIARIKQIWIDCRERYEKSGPFLFGEFGGADAMFAPVVHRFRTYAIEVGPDALAYMQTMMSLPAFQEWTRAGLAETLLIERVEKVRGAISFAEPGSLDAALYKGSERDFSPMARCRIRQGGQRLAATKPQVSLRERCDFRFYRTEKPAKFAYLLCPMFWLFEPPVCYVATGFSSRPTLAGP